MTKWVTKKLGEIAHINRGGSPRPIDAFVTDREDGINWIKIGDIDPDGKYVNSTSERIISEGKCHSREVHKGDFILSNSMSFGRPYILNIDGCIHDGWLAIQDYETYFDTDFLYYLLSSDIVKKQYLSMASGSTVLNLNKEKVARLQIHIPIQDDGTPDLAEQRRIAAILGSADKVIATSEALIEKYKHIKQGLLTDLLQPKEGWKKVKLGECCDTDLGKTLDGGRNTGQYMPYLCALNVLWGKIDLSTIKQMRIEESEKERYLIKRGDLLVCEGGEIGRCAIWDSDEEIYYQNALHRVRFKEEYDATFFMYLLGHYNDLNLIEKYGKGLTIMHLNQTSFRNIPVLVPDLTEQRRIASILSSIDAKILAEEKVVEKYKGVKKGLMEELLSSEN